MDVSRLTAIDVHTHVHCSVHANDRQESSDELAHVFGSMPQLTVPELADYYPLYEVIAEAGHEPQVYIDLSGWSPKYFPPQLVAQANSLLRHKVLFGYDFPALTPRRWLDDLARLPIKDEVRPLILKENAARLFGLGSPTPTDGT